MKHFLAATALLMFVGLPHAAEDAVDSENRKIDYLIASIEILRDAEFIRNGKSYDAKAAADHLRLKRRKAGSRVRTAEDFIKYCAAGSSMSGKPYQIRFADGTSVFTAEYLRGKLAGYPGNGYH